MADNDLINIGTKENPILVPRKALTPEADAGREWWEGVASGSIVLDDEKLKKLLESTSDGKKQG